MAARKPPDLDLSLSGSQIHSARSTSRRPSTSSLSSGKPPAFQGNDQANASASSGLKKRLNSAGDATTKENGYPSFSNGGAAHSPSNRGISEDFLALFESNGARPKTNISQSVKKVRASESASGSVHSVSSSPRSKKTIGSQISHSIFRPDSPMSVTTADDCSIVSARSNLSGAATSRTMASGAGTSRPAANSIASRLSSSAMRLENGLLNNEIDPKELPRSPASFPDSGDMIHNRVSKLSPNINKEKQTQSRQTRASTSDNKDLNATNNMLPKPADSKLPPKLELRNMQNSYQNPTYNVNKTPVNEIQAPFLVVSTSEAEAYINKVNRAACVIQKAFRRYVRRKKALRGSEAAMKRLLTQKRNDFTQKQLKVSAESECENQEKERKRLREERARQVRQQAIEELNRRRNEEKIRSKEIAEAEMESLKVEGKVGRKRAAHIPAQRKDKQPSTTKQGGCATTDITPERHTPNPDQLLPSNGIDKLSNEQLTPDAIQDTQSSTSKGVLSRSAPDTTRSTLDDLMNTLKLLEEEEHLPHPPESKTKAWDHQVYPENDDTFLTADNLERFGVTEEVQQMEGQPLSNSKLKSILSFLDDIETGDRLQEIDNSVERIEAVASLPLVSSLMVPSAEELAQLEQASQTASEVTSTVLKQRLQLEERTRTVQMLQKALNQQRELTIRHAKETEKEMKNRLEVQKQESEETIQRHLNFIDQLIDDKKNLTDKCEQLVNEVKQMEKRFSDKMKQMQEGHDRELAKVKEMISAQEKIKREKWIEEKTKKIKDLTVKGLEPEIQRLISKHKAEIKKLKSIQEAEMLQADERAGQRYVSMTEELRDQLAKEKESACQRERELAAQRYEKQLAAEEEAYQQARRRLYQEIQEEKERLAQQASRQRLEIDKLQRQLEDSHASAVDAVKREYEKAREEQERRHSAEVSEIKERLSVEKDAWEQNYMKKQEAWLLAKERELKEQVKRERDKEIELVISQLEEDGLQAREECERAAENRIKRIREKYESEMEELERSERQALEKYNSMKAELLQAQGEQERLKVLFNQKEQEVDDVKRLSEKLHRERDHVQDVVRQEFADRIVATEEENRRLKQEMAELKSRHKLEIERMKQEVELVNKSKQEEMDAVHSRVKQAIAKKEEVVNQVKQQYMAALKRADHLESLMEQQRKQLLTKK